ncbi:MAG: glycerol-3-phosphate acyltransferase, partial [Clostridia bacterium]|nr:glycerol-3-phosphate acyltransferase [Clostridia bacterium]
VGTRYISLASVMCAMLYPLILRAFANDGLNVAMAVVAAIFVVYMHRENLKRLWEGKESKIDFSKISKKKKGASEDGPDEESK